MTEPSVRVAPIPGKRPNAACRLIDEVTGHTFRAIPRSTIGGPDVQVARRVHSRCVSRYQAIGLLLAFNQPDDGYALLRGLMLDAQRLQVMARRPTARVALAIGWMEGAVRDLEDRAATADRVGERRFAAAIRAITVPQREALDRVQRESGVRRRLHLPDEGKPLAVAAGHPEDELDYVIGSDPTHGSLPASLWHDRGVAGGGAIVVGGSDAGWRNTVADRATRHMVRATAALAAICGFPNSADVSAYAADIERRLDAEDLPGKD